METEFRITTVKSMPTEKTDRASEKHQHLIT